MQQGVTQGVSREIPKECGISPYQRRWGFLQEESPMEQNLIVSAGWKGSG